MEKNILLEKSKIRKLSIEFYDIIFCAVLARLQLEDFNVEGRAILLCVRGFHYQNWFWFPPS